MSEPMPSWEDLNAYVDGELAPPQAAAVARALAEDRKLADQVAALTRLKAAVHETVAGVELPQIAPQRHSRRLAVPIAAAAALLLAVGAGLFLGVLRPAEPVWLARVLAAHRQWVKDDRRLDEPLQAGVVLARLHQLDPDAQVPDLAAARLAVDFVGPFDPDGKNQGLLIGYVGTRSCHVSLLIFPAPAGLGEEQQEYRHGSASLFAWRAGRLGYVLTAVGMDESHLTLIARTVEQAIRERQPLDAEARTALRHSRNVSRPCAT